MTRKYYATDMNKAMFVGFMRQLDVEIKKKSDISHYLKRGLIIDRFDNWQSWFENESKDTGFRTIIFDPYHLGSITKFRIQHFLEEWGFVCEKVEE